ncbi:MAG: sugar phosphate isomerase/epimerase [Clostridia bacterium]|nr:sugar phosphate isomerase/epimerase [Clostridia bacterium]
MSVGLSTAAFYGLMETEDAAGIMREFGIPVCEVFLQTQSEYRESYGREIRERLGPVRCVSVHPKGTQFENDLTGASPRQRRDGLEIFGHVLDAANAAGASFYVMHGIFAVRGRIHPDTNPRVQEYLPEVISYAKRRGIQVLWENVSWCSMRDPEDVRTVRRLFPEVGFVLDTKQAAEAGALLPEMTEAMGDRLRHVHVLDRDENGKLCLPGEGITDWEGFFRGLKKIGYRGDVILEPYSYLSGDRERLKRSLRFLEEMERET